MNDIESVPSATSKPPVKANFVSENTAIPGLSGSVHDRGGAHTGVSGLAERPSNLSWLVVGTGLIIAAAL